MTYFNHKYYFYSIVYSITLQIVLIQSVDVRIRIKFIIIFLKQVQRQNVRV